MLFLYYTLGKVRCETLMDRPTKNKRSACHLLPVPLILLRSYAMAVIVFCLPDGSKFVVLQFSLLRIELVTRHIGLLGDTVFASSLFLFHRFVLVFLQYM
ncbi:hypothetical protein BJ742DRAFT_551930 [Cladochytrium replicatum]|nr:hypothetical protein BJ742DRAFT_551930 [Cladochytrium replicatum]